MPSASHWGQHVPGSPHSSSQRLGGGRASNAQQQSSSPPLTSSSLPLGPIPACVPGEPLPCQQAAATSARRGGNRLGVPGWQGCAGTLLVPAAAAPMNLPSSSSSCHLHRDTILKDSSLYYFILKDIFSLTAFSPVPVEFLSSTQRLSQQQKLLLVQTYLVSTEVRLWQETHKTLFSLTSCKPCCTLQRS